MQPLTPKSIKMTTDTCSRIRKDAVRIGYSDNQFIVEAVQAVLDMIETEYATVPKLVVLIRSARAHEVKPLPLNGYGRPSGEECQTL
jgi:hypothetical protein